MAMYSATFRNQTNRKWTLAIYPAAPGSMGLDCVPCKEMSVVAGARDRLSFTPTFELAAYRRRRELHRCRATQGSAWIIGSRLRPTFAAPAGKLIRIGNRSGESVTVGLGEAGSAQQPDVPSGANAQFEIRPTFWAGLFNEVEEGEVIASNIAVGPLELRYPSEQLHATIIAAGHGHDTVLTVDYEARAR